MFRRFAGITIPSIQRARPHLAVYTFDGIQQYGGPVLPGLKTPNWIMEIAPLVLSHLFNGTQMSKLESCYVTPFRKYLKTLLFRQEYCVNKKYLYINITLSIHLASEPSDEPINLSLRVLLVSE